MKSLGNNSNQDKPDIHHHTATSINKTHVNLHVHCELLLCGFNFIII
jgi:hypothetical protein